MIRKDAIAIRRDHRGAAENRSIAYAESGASKGPRIYQPVTPPRPQLPLSAIGERFTRAFLPARPPSAHQAFPASGSLANNAFRLSLVPDSHFRRKWRAQSNLRVLPGSNLVSIVGNTKYLAHSRVLRDTDAALMHSPGHQVLPPESLCSASKGRVVFVEEACK